MMGLVSRSGHTWAWVDPFRGHHGPVSASFPRAQGVRPVQEGKKEGKGDTGPLSPIGKPSWSRALSQAG